MIYKADKCLICNTYQLGAYFCINHCGSEVVTVEVTKSLYAKVYGSKKAQKG